MARGKKRQCRVGPGRIDGDGLQLADAATREELGLIQVTVRVRSSGNVCAPGPPTAITSRAATPAIRAAACPRNSTTTTMRRGAGRVPVRL